MTPAGQHRIFHLLQLAAHKVKIRGDRDAQAIAGITAAQAAVLFVVRASSGATTQRAVAKQLNQQESAITAMVSRLLDAGLLTREPSRADRRAWTLRVTPKAEDALRRFRRPLDALNARITKAVGGAAEVDTLARALKNIIDEV